MSKNILEATMKRFAKVEVIETGWSEDKKLCVTDQDRTKYLHDYSGYRHHLHQFGIICICSVVFESEEQTARNKIVYFFKKKAE